MKKIYILLVVLFSIGELFSQARFTQPRNYRAIIIIKRDGDKLTAEELKHIISFENQLINSLKNELTKQIPCLKVSSMKDIGEAIRKDRQISLDGGESHIEEIMNTINNAEFQIIVHIATGNRRMDVYGKTYRHPDPHPINDDPLTDFLTDNETDYWAQKFAISLSKYFQCPFEGKFMYSSSLKTSKKKSASHTSDDGKASSSFTQLQQNELTEDWDLDVKIDRNPAGTCNYYLLDYFRFDSESQGRCLKYEDGAWLDIFEGYGNSSEHIEKKDELRIKGLEKDEKNDKTYFRIEYNTDSTYLIHVKAISKPSLFTKSYYHQQNFSCPGPPFPTASNKQVFKMLKTLDRTFGPYPGKASDKVLTQRITTDFPCEDGTSTETIFFELRR